MRNCLTSLLVFSLCTTPVFAGGSPGKVLLDTWDVTYLGDGRAGYVHTISKEIEVDGKKVVHTTLELRLTVKRFDGTIEIGMDTGTLETPDGKVTGVFTKQYNGKKQQTQIDGTVAGKRLELTLNGKTSLNSAPWDSDVLGLFKQQTLLKDRDAKPGDKLTFRAFEPSINLVLKYEVNVKGYRDVLLKGSKEKRKLLLVETIPEKVDFKRGADKVEKIQLPASLTWYDENLEPVKTEMDVPPLGPLVMHRSTKAAALAPGPVAQIDLGYNQLVRLKNRILRPYETAAAVYRITIRNDDNVATTFSQDDRQDVKNVRGNSFELHVKASKGSSDGEDRKAPGVEFTQSSYFINSDDVEVKKHARKAVGEETDAWKKTLRIERWVHDNMRVTNDEALATADHVARTLEGDCTEFAMLTAAMCRAEGVPSRTAIGLIYADVKGAPCFAFHMWTEVWIKGRWISIDATLGKGYVGATHLKITDHSWYDERTMTPIFPVIRVVGRVNIEVLSAENR
jgi:Transglutaminase-like superfamily